MCQKIYAEKSRYRAGRVTGRKKGTGSTRSTTDQGRRIAAIYEVSEEAEERNQGKERQYALRCEKSWKDRKKKYASPGRRKGEISREHGGKEGTAMEPSGGEERALEVRMCRQYRIGEIIFGGKRGVKGGELALLGKNKTFVF